MKRTGQTVQMICYGGLTAAAVAFWVYYLLVVYPKYGADTAAYHVLEWIAQPVFYAALPALLCFSARRAGKLALAPLPRRLCFGAAVVLVAGYAVYTALLFGTGGALPGAQMLQKHEELLLLPGILWGLGVPGVSSDSDFY